MPDFICNELQFRILPDKTDIRAFLQRQRGQRFATVEYGACTLPLCSQLRLQLAE